MEPGFAAGTGDWTLILDDDCHLEGDALARAVTAAEANRADLVSFRVRSGIERDYFFDDGVHDRAVELLGLRGPAQPARGHAHRRL